MKIPSKVKLILLLSTVISFSSEAGNKTLQTWGGNVMNHVHKHWKTNQNKSSEFKNQMAKVKLTISNNGQILGSIDFSCQGSLSFCSSVSKALIKAEPFPLPPENLRNIDRTLTMSFN